MNPIFRRVARTCVALSLAAVALVSLGCSQDRHVFRSTPTAPKAVSIVSTETGNTLWSMNVPPGQQLFLDFSRKNKGGEQYSSPDIAADKVKWETWSLDAVVKWNHKRKGGKKFDGGTVKLPGQSILIKVDVLDPQVAASAQ